MDGDSFCAYCSRMKRGIMYTVCRREGYGVLALAQHLDDLAESFLMSGFHGGQLRTMQGPLPERDADLEKKIMNNLRHLIGRAGLTEWEMKMLKGLYTQVEHMVKKKC